VKTVTLAKVLVYGRSITRCKCYFHLFSPSPKLQKGAPVYHVVAPLPDNPLYVPVMCVE
jgi:hypothetical protein